MFKKVGIVIAVLLSLVGLFGCTSSSTTGPKPAQVNIIREAQISPVWAVKQMEISMEKQIPIVLTLAPGDQVEGYFYCIFGDNVSFNISGNSPIYTTAAGQSMGSERFSFTASQAQGIAYILDFSPVKRSGEDKASATIFLEIQYPVSGTISMPIETK
jgi:hypothetical protein